MKIKHIYADYDKVIAMKKPPKLHPKKPSKLMHFLMRAALRKDLKNARFTYEFPDKDKIGKGPFLILMNHSSFIDFEIACEIFRSMPFNIVCTSDGFVGKSAILRTFGCIPTKKFVTDVGLISDISYALKTQKTNVLMYPEASYSFDGTATPLPRKLGVLVKRLGVTVLMVRTYGAFTRDPLYNCLQKRDVSVSAKVSVLVSGDKIASLSVPALDDLIDKAFTFDNFAWQKDNNVVINESFRADGLERILYKCPHCGAEGVTEGKGINLTCTACKKSYELTPLGEMKALSGETEFSHIPSWYAWQRECVKKEISDGSYKAEIPVKIGMMVNFKAIYMVGEGVLSHDENGFTLIGCDGKLDYRQNALASYGLYSDYFWYEIGDVVCIGNSDVLYYCFPIEKYPVAKTRLAAEEIYKKAYLAKKNAIKSNR